MCVISHRRPEAPSASDTRRFSTGRVVSVLPRVHCSPGTVLSYCWWAFFVPGHHGRPSNEHFYHQEAGVKSPLCCSELLRPLFALFPLQSMIWPSGRKDQVRLPGRQGAVLQLISYQGSPAGRVRSRMNAAGEILSCFHRWTPVGSACLRHKVWDQGDGILQGADQDFCTRSRTFQRLCLVTVPVSRLQEIKGNWPSVYNIWIQHNLAGGGFGNIVLTINLKNTVFKYIFFLFMEQCGFVMPLDHLLIYFTSIYSTLMLFSPAVIRQEFVFMHPHFLEDFNFWPTVIPVYWNKKKNLKKCPFSSILYFHDIWH